jgi:hypothetical protein
MEPVPEPPSLSSPRGAWEVWKARLAARDWKGLYEVQTRAYREEHPYEGFVEEMSGAVEQIESYLESAHYAGTAIEGEKAHLALRSPGSPRPHYILFLREEGEWRMAD